MYVIRKSKADAFILIHPTKGFVVRPTYVVLDGTADEIEFTIRNLTGLDNTWVELPGDRLDASETATKKEAKKGHKEVAKFKLTKSDGSFRYSVKVGDNEARGESDPVIIIDPPTP